MSAPVRGKSTAARRLGVTTFLEGGIRTDAFLLQVTARLINASTGAELWRARFERPLSEMFSIQEDIAQRVARALRPDLDEDSRKRLVSHQTSSPDAHHRHLLSRHHLQKRTIDSLRKSIGYAQEAIGLDARYAPAYADLAQGLAVLSSYSAEPPRDLMEPARRAASEAVALDDTLDEAHAILGFIHLAYDWDWDASARAYAYALTLNPYNPTTHYFEGLRRLAVGEIDGAVRSVLHARSLAPLSLIVSTQVSWLLYFRRDYEAAIAELEVALDLEPNFWRAYLNLAWCHLARCDYDRALVALTRARTLNDFPTLSAIDAGARWLAGDRDGATGILANVDASGRYVSPYWLAVTLLQMGRPDRALEALERAVTDRDFFLTHITQDPAFDSLKGDARFNAIVEHVGLAPTTHTADSGV